MAYAIVALLSLSVFPSLNAAGSDASSGTTPDTFPVIEPLNLSKSAESVQYAYGDYIRYLDPTPGEVTTDDIIVGIVDTGIDDSHPDFEDGQIVYWKDIHWRVEGGAMGVVTEWEEGDRKDKPYDDEGHGTSCAGIIGGVGSCNKNYSGVFPGVKLAIIKIFPKSGSGRGLSVYEAINYLSKMDADSDGLPDVDVISLSFGQALYAREGDEDDQNITKAIHEAREKGIIIAAAAGNGILNTGVKCSADISYPSSSPNVITVGACDKNGEPLPVLKKEGNTIKTSSIPGAYFSNLDPEVTAWGVNVPAPTIEAKNYTSFSGTSAACPHIAGVAARLIYEAYLLGIKVTPGYIENLILKTADHYPIADVKYGNKDILRLDFPYLIEGYGHVDITEALEVLREAMPMPEGDPIDNLHYNTSKKYKETYTNDTQIEGGYCNGGMISNNTYTPPAPELNNLPVADFIYSTLNPVNAQAVQFEDISTDSDGYIVNQTWDFGDGSTAYGRKVTHGYGSVNAYTVKLTVTDNHRAKRHCEKTLIFLSSSPNECPAADFIYAPDPTGQVNLIQFMDLSTDQDEEGRVIAWSWDINGDGIVDSHSQNPTYQYDKSGEYKVTLTVMDNRGGKGSCTKTINTDIVYPLKGGKCTGNCW